MPNTTPLTDAINALTTYANETTGASDTNLSDAVETLVDGYGQGGGGITIDGLSDLSEPVGAITLNVVPKDYSFYGRYNVTSVHAVGFQEQNGWNYAFQSATGLITAVVGYIGNNYGSTLFRQCTSLETVDFTGARLRNQIFLNCTHLSKLILRNTNVTEIENTSIFNGTPFASGGSGGTIYVPSSLISSYKSATNWSTIDGYGTITWEAIEGSIYETQYADGTPIS